MTQEALRRQNKDKNTQIGSSCLLLIVNFGYLIFSNFYFSIVYTIHIMIVYHNGVKSV